jgi:four helix bundle protein
MTNNIKYDLEERTAGFGEDIIKFARNIRKKIENVPLISQLVRAGTSIGANYCEADDASTKKDFLNKISICKKEARETKYWLRMIITAEPALNNHARILLQEVKELHLIFASIWRKGKAKVNEEVTGH